MENNGSEDEEDDSKERPGFEAMRLEYLAVGVGERGFVLKKGFFKGGLNVWL